MNGSSFRALCAALLFGFLPPAPAQASVSVAVSFEELARRAEAAAVVVPLEKQSVWEDGSIVTYTRVKIERIAGGTLDGGEGGSTWIKSRGGVVGNVGQYVEGEPSLEVGTGKLVFLMKFEGSYRVVARGQGEVAITLDARGTRVMSAVQSAGHVVSLPNVRVVRVSEVLSGMTLDLAVARVASEWRRHHAG